jgi:fucose permease
MVTVTWMIWPEVIGTGVVRVVPVSGPKYGSGVVCVAHVAGLLVSIVLGTAASPTLEQRAMAVETAPITPVWLAVIEPESTIE